MMPNDSYYDILNVEPTATQAEIIKSYRKIARKHHPDKNNNKTTKDFSMVNEAKDFSMVNEAYECLSCPEKRKEYDLSNPPRINPVFKDIFDTNFGSSILNK